MKFHWPSFLIGCGVGAGTVLVGKRLQPLLVEVATALYDLSGAVLARVTMAREDLEDVLAEARARAQTAVRGPARAAARPARSRKRAS